MIVETPLHAVLIAVSARVFPDFAPEGTVRPFIVYQQVGGVAPTFLERAVPSKENGRFQITVWAATRIESKTIAKAIELAMVAATAFDAKPLGAPVALVDDSIAPPLRGTAQDYTVWNDR